MALAVLLAQLPLDGIAISVLTALSSNTLSKCILDWVSRGRQFTAYVIAGQLIIIVALWSGFL